MYHYVASGGAIRCANEGGRTFNGGGIGSQLAPLAAQLLLRVVGFRYLRLKKNHAKLECCATDDDVSMTTQPTVGVNNETLNRNTIPTAPVTAY